MIEAKFTGLGDLKNGPVETRLRLITSPCELVNFENGIGCLPDHCGFGPVMTTPRTVERPLKPQNDFEDFRELAIPVYRPPFSLSVTVC